MSKKISNALSRADEFFANLIRKEMWILTGFIEGEEKKPILIIHYATINISIYTQKLERETLENFSRLASLNLT